jgi:hypothetical protein
MNVSAGFAPYFPTVTPLPHDLVKKASKLVCCAMAVTVCGIARAQGAETARQDQPSHDDGLIPQPLQIDEFAALIASPPFTRSLNRSDSLILTGVARIDKDVVATVFDTETQKAQVVSQTPNQEGWQLLGVGGDPADALTWTAKIQIPGGEVISIRYQPPPPKRGQYSSGAYGSGSGSGSSAPLTASQLEEAKKAAVNYREGFSSDGYPSQPPPEMVARLSRLSVDQREEINRQMISIRNRGTNMSMDERRRIYESMVDRASQNRR